MQYKASSKSILDSFDHYRQWCRNSWIQKGIDPDPEATNLEHVDGLEFMLTVTIKDSGMIYRRKLTFRPRYPEITSQDVSEKIKAVMDEIIEFHETDHEKIKPNLLLEL